MNLVPPRHCERADAPLQARRASGKRGNPGDPPTQREKGPGSEFLQSDQRREEERKGANLRTDLF